MFEQVTELDVRDDLRQGHDPFSRIIGAVSALSPGGRLRLIAPFKPEPMIRLLGGRGFTCAAQAQPGGDWHVLIERPNADTDPLPASPPACPGRPTAGAEAGPSPAAEAEPPAAKPRRELDARGLEPPEPLMRILEAVETLPAGEELWARTDRRPVFLYEQLEERGLAAESEDAPEGGVVTRIWRREA